MIAISTKGVSSFLIIFSINNYQYLSGSSCKSITVIIFEEGRISDILSQYFLRLRFYLLTIINL